MKNYNFACCFVSACHLFTTVGNECRLKVKNCNQQGTLDADTKISCLNTPICFSLLECLYK